MQRGFGTAQVFETGSAIATVGLTLGVTPTLGTAARLVLIALMYCGRVGGLTLVFAALSGMRSKDDEVPRRKSNCGIRYAPLRTVWAGTNME